MKEKSQKERVLDRLNEGGWLPMTEALHWSPPITRLGARIWDLRHEGYIIDERKVPGKSWSEYRLRPAQPVTLPDPFPKKAEEKIVERDPAQLL